MTCRILKRQRVKHVQHTVPRSKHRPGEKASNELKEEYITHGTDTTLHITNLACNQTGGRRATVGIQGAGAALNPKRCKVGLNPLGQRWVVKVLEINSLRRLGSRIHTQKTNQQPAATHSTLWRVAQPKKNRPRTRKKP